MKARIQENINLANFSTFRIGGEVEYFAEIRNKEDLIFVFDWLEDKNLDVNILGGGSNILINDKKIKGLVLKLANNNVDFRENRAECGAGVSLGKVILESKKKSLSGLEWAVGIPQATIGGAVRGNAGAFGFNMSEIVETVEYFDTQTKSFKLFSNKDCKFDYRESIFKHNSNLIIWNVFLKMKKDEHKNIEDRMTKFLKYRHDHHPKLPSAGSIFKNIPISNIEEASQYLAKEAKEAGVVKNDMVGAGWIIELSGLKGKKIGGAKVSLEHANFIVNTGKAKANDIVMLISYIKQQVRDRFKIQLQEELQYFGF